MAKYNRVWVDGCFDLCHFGHFNFLRQVSAFGNEVHVGIHNDAAVLKNKGPAVFTLKERMELVQACKWVTKAIGDAPYVTEMEWLDKYECDVCMHGDDIVLDANGIDTYHIIKDNGRFATVPRTKAISTTNLIGRMLRLPPSQIPASIKRDELQELAGTATSLHTYIPTTHRIAEFSCPNGPKPTDRIVYCDGTFDLLHPGHVSFLRKAKELGDYLVVGVHDDVTMEGLTCPGMPIMTLQERVLNVLAMKYVDDVIIGAPYVITRELMDQIGPTVVVEGSAPSRSPSVDAFAIPKQMGIFRQVASDYPELTAKEVVARVLENYALFATRNKSKEQSSPDIALPA
jgi:ethanolamine-phosphate cytidylyltransferase